MSQEDARTWILRKEVHQFLYGQDQYPYGESDDVADLLALILESGASHFQIESRLRSFVLEDYGSEFRFGVAFQESAEVATSANAYEVQRFDGNPASMEDAVSQHKTVVLRTPMDLNLLESVLGTDVHEIEDMRVFFDADQGAARALGSFQGLNRLSLLGQVGGFDAKHLTANSNLKRLSLSGGGELNLSGIEQLQGLQHIELSRFLRVTDVRSLAGVPHLDYAYIEDIGHVDDEGFVMKSHRAGVCDVLGYAAWASKFPDAGRWNGAP